MATKREKIKRDMRQKWERNWRNWEKNSEKVCPNSRQKLRENLNQSFWEFFLKNEREIREKFRQKWDGNWEKLGQNLNKELSKFKSEICFLKESDRELIESLTERKMREQKGPSPIDTSFPTGLNPQNLNWWNQLSHFVLEHMKTNWKEEKKKKKNEISK